MVVAPVTPDVLPAPFKSAFPLLKGLSLLQPVHATSTQRGNKYTFFMAVRF